jgi:Ca-activated chloride channel family protein
MRVSIDFKGQRVRYGLIGTIFLCLFPCTNALSGEDPDELYRQGRFNEAEKIYSRADMDHPKDVRYRYNRGCAAYQGSDYKAATAAFSSVLRRTKDRGILFKTAYNIGNASFKKGDFHSAAAFYKQAIVYNPDSDEARYNLEMSLREIERIEREKKEKAQKQCQKDSSKNGEKGSQQKGSEKNGSSGKRSQEKMPDQEQSKSPETAKGDEKDGAGPRKKPEEQKQTGQSQDQENDEGSPKDLSGELRPRQPLPEQNQGEKPQGPSISMMDKKRAEALLDNIKEDRSKFLKFQVPKSKRHGVTSEMDW